MDIEIKQRIQEIDKEIERLMAEKAKLNPFANLKEMSWKSFGEQFSENYVLEHVSNLVRMNGVGHDMYSKKLGYIEVKSGRLPYKNGWTMNQLHPSQCDYYLFVFYDTIEAEVSLFLIPTEDLVSEKFKLTKQHGNGCFSMKQTKKNEKALEEYRIIDWKTLNSLV